MEKLNVTGIKNLDNLNEARRNYMADKLLLTPPQNYRLREWCKNQFDVNSKLQNIINKTKNNDAYMVKSDLDYLKQIGFDFELIRSVKKFR